MIWIGDPKHGVRIAHAAGVGYDLEFDRVISRLTGDGKLAGGFVFTNYTKVAIQMHMAGFVPGWCSPELLVLAFDYPFNRLKVQRVIGTVPSTNLKALDQDLRVGWKEIARIEGAVEGGDMVVLSMSREQCKWLRFVDRYVRRLKVAA
jgi:hypothetical protein